MSSGGPPHHSHNRQVPNANAAAAAAWNHLQAQLQVPNYFPRQPQAAHTHPMPPSDHTMHPAHQHQAPPPSWHTPTTTDAMKMLPNIQHTHMLNEMLKQEGLFRGREGVDLSFSRNGNQNGELLSAPHPISLSVRDTNKINSLSGLDIQVVNSPGMKPTISPSLTITPSVTGSPGLKSVSPGLKSASPGMKSGSPGVKTGSPSHKSHSPAPKSGSPGLGANLGGLLSMANLPNIPAAALGIAAMEAGGKNQQKRSNIRVDSILERLNPVAEKSSQDHQAVGSGSFPIRPDLHAASVNRGVEVGKPSHEAAHQFAMARKQAEMLASLQGGLGPETLNPAAMANMQRFLEMAMSKNVIPDLSHVLRQDLAQLKHDAVPNTSNVTKNDSSNASITLPQIPVPSNLNIIDRSSNKDQILLDNRDKTNVDSRKPSAIEKDGASGQDKVGQQSGVIVQPAPSFDENSNSSSIANAPTPVKEDDSGSMHSNEDSLDSTKSRRKRKPSKTIKVLTKEDDGKDDKSEKLLSIEDTLSSQSSRIPVNEPTSVSSILNERTTDVAPPTSRIPERRRSSDDLDALISPTRTRRKTSSESETIDNIAAMVQQGLNNKTSNKEKSKTGDILAALRGVRKNSLKDQNQPSVSQPVPAPVSVIKTKEAVPEPSICSPLNPVLSARDEIDGPVIKDTDYEKKEDTKKDQTEVVKEAARATSRASPVMTPAQKKASNTHFVEVENKLEEMFGGILGEQPLTQPSGSTVNGESLVSDLLGHSDVDSSLTKFENDKEDNVTEDKPKEEATTDSEKKEDLKINPKKGKRSRARSRQGLQIMEDGESGAKKGRFTKGKTPSKARKPSKSPLPVSAPASTATATSTSKSKPKVPVPPSTTSPSGSTSSKANAKSAEPVKDVYAYDSGSNASSSKSRGPFVQIKGHRESPVSVSIVNTPFVDEDGDKKPLKSKKFHDDSEYRHKVRSKGLHCSTLSNKYDAQTKDATWICAFCKRGPHASELSGPSVISDSSTSPQGDLFGPYFITTQCPEFERRLDDPYDKQFKSKKIGKALDGGASIPGPSKSKNKSKRKHSESSLDPSDIYLGITSTGQNSYEVWAHENCLIWSQGVYLVGPKIVGLEEAVWSSCNVSCAACHLKGANISCIKRGCLSMTHLCCARSNGWVFDEDQFKAYCPQHSLQWPSRKTGPEKKS